MPLPVLRWQGHGHGLGCQLHEDLNFCCHLARFFQEVRAAEVPAWLPKYDLDIQLGIDQHEAHVRERVTWHNRHEQVASELVFNAHSHYKLPPTCKRSGLRNP